MAEKRKPRRVFLHVGLPDAGSDAGSVVAASLARHAEALLEQGLRYPDGGADMRRAALDVTGQDVAWGEHPDAVRGAFTRIATKRPGRKLDLLISHDLLACASAEQASYALSMLANAEVHLVVVSPRQVGSGESPDLVDVLQRWGADLPPEQVHVVVAPPPGSDPALRWDRFGEALGRDVSALAPVGEETRGLDAVALALRARVTESLADRPPGRPWSAAVMDRYVRKTLGARSAGRAAPPLPRYDVATDLAERWTKEIDAVGWIVHGDLADLRPARPIVPSADATHAGDLPANRVLDLAVETSADLLVELAGQRERIAELEADVVRLHHKRDKLKRRLRRAGR